MILSIKELEKAAMEIRINLLRLCNRQVIHIGGDLSITDVMTVLWQYKMNYDPNDVNYEFRDRFVLSKGHASAVMSFNQAAIGCFKADDVINEYATDEGRFSMHSCNLVNPFVEVSTGSLGHGMPIACGIAAGLRLKENNKSRVYTIGNLVAIVDFNGLEADGTINEITGLGNIADKYRAFGWNVVEINGNEIAEIKETFDNLPPPESDFPTCIIAHTIKGKGVGFMENQVRWHAGKISDEELESSILELRCTYDKRWSNE